MRWIKTAENATDYSIMNTARQLLWLPASREEKYKAKQAIDTFFVRGGDVLRRRSSTSAARLLHLNVQQFAIEHGAHARLTWRGDAYSQAALAQALPEAGSLEPEAYLFTRSLAWR